MKNKKRLQEENRRVIAHIKEFNLTNEEETLLKRLSDGNEAIYRSEKDFLKTQEELIKLRNSILKREEEPKNMSIEVLETMGVINFIKENGDPEDFLYKKYTALTQKEIKKYIEEGNRIIHKIYEYRTSLLN